MQPLLNETTGAGEGVRLGICEPEVIKLRLPNTPLDGKDVHVINLDTAAAVDKAALMLQLAMKGKTVMEQKIILTAFMESLNHPPAPMAKINAAENS